MAKEKSGSRSMVPIVILAIALASVLIYMLRRIRQVEKHTRELYRERDEYIKGRDFARLVDSRIMLMSGDSQYHPIAYPMPPPPTGFPTYMPPPSGPPPTQPSPPISQPTPSNDILISPEVPKSPTPVEESPPVPSSPGKTEEEEESDTCADGVCYYEPKEKEVSLNPTRSPIKTSRVQTDLLTDQRPTTPIMRSPNIEVMDSPFFHVGKSPDVTQEEDDIDDDLSEVEGSTIVFEGPPASLSNVLMTMLGVNMEMPDKQESPRVTILEETQTGPTQTVRAVQQIASPIIQKDSNTNSDDPSLEAMVNNTISNIAQEVDN